jgi:hypothetical protein
MAKGRFENLLSGRSKTRGMSCGHRAGTMPSGLPLDAPIGRRLPAKTEPRRRDALTATFYLVAKANASGQKTGFWRLRAAESRRPRAFLRKFHDHRVDGEAVAGLRQNFLDGHVALRAQDILHLHRLDHA